MRERTRATAAFFHVARGDTLGGDGLHRIAANGHSLSISLYIKRHVHGVKEGKSEDQRSLREVRDAWEQDRRVFRQQMDALVETLDGLTADQPDSGTSHQSSTRRSQCPLIKS
jgi:hypothetical protein